MFEKDFLAHILSITLLEIRMQACERGNKKLYLLSHMLHNIPFSLLNDEMSKKQYAELLKDVNSYEVEDWLEMRKEEFYKTYQIFLEKDFLAHALSVTLLEIKDQAYDTSDKRLYWLCHILHNVPISLLSDELAKENYKELIGDVNSLEIFDWLETRKEEFYRRFPEYLKE